MRHRSYYCKEKPHGCDVCKKTFTNIENLKQHKFVHMDKKLKFQCHICKKYFSRNEHLKRHQRNVHGVTTNSGIFCELCDESFTSAIALHNHNINQHNVKCEECGKVFSSEAAIKRHKRNHINSGIYLFGLSL